MWQVPIDRTLLKTELQPKEQIKVLCEEARDYSFASVLRKANFWVKYASELLEGVQK